MRGDQPMSAASIIYLGTDVHKDFIKIAVLPIGAKTPTHLTGSLTSRRSSNDSSSV